MIYSNGVRYRASSSWFSNCCGATYARVTAKTNVKGNHKGIKVWDEKIGEEYCGPKQSLTHVKTKNGTLTVSIRHTW